MNPTDDRVREGVEHLQTAALEMIAAARIFLDVAEDLVRDPSDLLAGVVKQPRPRDRGGDDDGVQRIRVV